MNESADQTAQVRRETFDFIVHMQLNQGFLRRDPMYAHLNIQLYRFVVSWWSFVDYKGVLVSV